jgi:D-psicose/D-tagatose/L-ribulose 3-epimerase
VVKIGISLQLWSAHLDDALWPVIEDLGRIGYDGVEVPIYDYEPGPFRDGGRRIRDLGLACTATTSLGAGSDPMSADAAERAAALDRLERAIDCTAALGAPVLCGPFHSALGVFSGNKPTLEEWDRSVDVMRRASDHAADRGVSLAVEFLNRFECYLLNCAADTAAYVRDVARPNLGIHYDTFHAHIEEKDITRSIVENGSLIRYVHLSENDRSTPGSGTVAWDATFDALHATGYDGWLTIEAFGLALPELAAATKIWRRMYVSEMQLASDGLAFVRSQVARRWP